MARFDVYSSREGRGYLVDVQADLMSVLNTRVVVPLLPVKEGPKPAARLNPIFSIEGSDFVLVTQFMAAVPVNELGKAQGTLVSRQFEIREALDMLFVGF